jgi:hypothetical protein
MTTFETFLKLAFPVYMALISGLYCYKRFQYNPQKQRILVICVLSMFSTIVMFFIPSAMADQANHVDNSVHRYLRYEHHPIQGNPIILAIPTKKNIRFVRELPFTRNARCSVTTHSLVYGPQLNGSSSHLNIHNVYPDPGVM